MDVKELFPLCVNSANIRGLCEKTFRRGYYHGYFAQYSQKITPEEAEAFWQNGVAEGFRQMIDPVKGTDCRSHKAPEPGSWDDQLERLLELQYRKGFLHGYLDGQNNLITPEKVYRYRVRGLQRICPQAEHPITGRNLGGLFIIHRELEKMDQVDELKMYF